MKHKRGVPWQFVSGTPDAAKAALAGAALKVNDRTTMERAGAGRAAARVAGLPGVGKLYVSCWATEDIRCMNCEWRLLTNFGLFERCSRGSESGHILPHSFAPLKAIRKFAVFPKQAL